LTGVNMKNKLEIQNAVDKYKKYFEDFTNVSRAQDPMLTRDLRRQAIEKLGYLNFPDSKTEEWRLTNIRQLLKENFNISPQVNNLNNNFNHLLLLEGIERNLIFADGFFLNEQEFKNHLPNGVIITNLQKAIRNNTELVLNHLNKYLNYTTGFDALNMAFFKDGLFIYLPENVEIKEPIQVLFYSKKEKEFSSLRNLIVLENGANLNLIINYAGDKKNKYFVNTINEIKVGENAHLGIYEIQNQSSKAYHLQKTTICQKDSSTVSHYEFTFEGGLIRNDIRVKLDGQNIESNLNGLYMLKGNQHVDNHTLIEHLKPNSNSSELYKGILKDKAHGVFSGKILVDSRAQKTNAYQSNKNILLSQLATVDTKPQLEIYADDVKCSHGATVGKLDEDSLFYIKSRGIPESVAKLMLIKAFASDVMEQVKIKNLKEILNSKISENLKEVNA